MKVSQLKQLPSEFDFKYIFAISDIIYHAKFRAHDVLVTWDAGRKTYSKNEFRRLIFDDEFVPILPEKEV